MKTTNVIGLIGKKRAGKDTVFRILQEFKGKLQIARIAFADALKEEMAKACQVPVQTIEENKEVFRLGLQWYGTEFRRQLYGDNYWIDRAAEKFSNLRYCDPQPETVVFTDVRFPNEVEFVRSLGGEIWRVNRTAVDNAGDGHASEMAWREVVPDLTLTNNGTFREFAEAVIASYLGHFK
jgi:hypothetical protein